MAENVDPNKVLRFADSPAGPSGLPPKTPGTSTSKKRKRSAASVAHDRDVNSKKCKTYKLYEKLMEWCWIEDVSDLDGLEERCEELHDLKKRFDAAVSEKVLAVCGPKVQECKEYKAKALQAVADCRVNEAQCNFNCIRLLERNYNLQTACGVAQQVRAEAAEAKLAAVEERDRWSEKIRELSKVQEEKDRYYAEVLELRKLKYAADRKAKGQVGVARKFASTVLAVSSAEGTRIVTRTCLSLIKCF